MEEVIDYWSNVSDKTAPIFDLEEAGVVTSWRKGAVAVVFHLRQLHETYPPFATGKMVVRCGNPLEIVLVAMSMDDVRY